MADIASHSRGATIGLLYDLHHIPRSVLHQIGEERSIVGYDREASTSHGPSFKPPVSSTPVRNNPLEVKGKGELIDEVVVEMVSKFVVEMVRVVVVHLSRHFLLPHPPYLPIIRYFYTSLYLPITRYFYTPTDLHITFHTPTHLHIFTISGVARANFHGSRYHLIIPPFIIPYIASHR